MINLILNDDSVIEVESEYAFNDVTTYVSDYTALQALMARLTNENLSHIKFVTSEGEDQYQNMTLLETNASITQRNTDIKVQFGFRELSDEESAKESVSIAIGYLNDEQALSVKDLYSQWDEDPIGYSYNIENPRDARRQYNRKLWKLAKSHNKQSDWFPGADPTLWTEIVEGYAGTIEDPIPVPDSVNTSGFEYVYGKYYLDGENIYLAKREGKEEGEIEKLFYRPSELVGHYFELAVKTEDPADLPQPTEDLEGEA